MERQAHLNPLPGLTRFHSEVFKSELWDQTPGSIGSSRTVAGSEPLFSQTWALRVGPSPGTLTLLSVAAPGTQTVWHPQTRGSFTERPGPSLPSILWNPTQSLLWKDSMRWIQTITKGGRRQTAPALRAEEGDGAYTHDQREVRGR